MSIFGTQSPKIVLSSGDEIMLDFVTVKNDEPEWDALIHQSKLDGTRNFINRGYHWKYEVILNTFRYPGGAPAREDLYNQLIAQLYQQVTLYRYRDGDPIKDSTGTVVPFLLTKVTPLYLKTVDYADQIVLEFKTTKYIDLSRSVSTDGLFLDFERNLEGGTFTRTGTAFVLNPDTGLIEQIADGLPRYVAGKFGGRAILLEGARTNIITKPSTFDDAGWVKTNVTVSANTTEVLDPQGNNNADKLTGTGATSTIEFTTGTAIGSDDGTATIQLRSPQGDVSVAWAIQGTTAGTETTGSVNINAGNGWTDLNVTHQNDGSLTGNWKVILQIPNGADIYAFHARLEVGTDVVFPSHQMSPTAGTSFTQNAESLTYPTTNINKDKGTIAFWFKSDFENQLHPLVHLLEIGTDITNRFFLIWADINALTLNFWYRKTDGTSNGATSTISLPTMQNINHHFAVTYDSTISNGVITYLNGVQQNISSNSPFLPADVGTSMHIGNNATDTAPAFGAFDRFFTSKRVLTAAEILELTKEKR